MDTITESTFKTSFDDFCVVEIANKAIVNKSDWTKWETIGYELLGSGHFSDVLAYPGNDSKAIKVSSRASDGGIAYAFWARENSDLKGVPKIHQIQEVMNTYGNIITVVVMDRYNCELDDRSSELCFNSSRNFYTIGYIFNSILRDGAKITLEHADFAVVEEVQEYIFTLEEIGRYFAGSIGFDLHNSNIMLNLKTKEYVFTDPLSFVKEKESC